MLRAMLAGATIALSLGAVAVAQESTALPAVQSMTCEQMLAEITTAGRTMNSQMDPQFAAEAQAMYQESQRRTPQPGDPAQNAAANMARMQALNERFESQNCGAQVQPR